MIQKFFNLEISTNGQKLYDFTDKTYDWIKDNNFKNGILNISVQHTSASLIVQENADPDVKTCLLYTSPSPRDRQKSRMPSSA